MEEFIILCMLEMPENGDGNGGIFYQWHMPHSPCIRAGDNKLLPIFTTKLHSMLMQDWKWLNNLGFGAVIFGVPQSKDTTLYQR